MKRILSLLSLFTIFQFTVVSAQEKCLSEIMFQQEAAKNPQLFQNREQLEEWTRNYVEQMNQPGAAERSTAAVKVIPVVVHVIHYGGPENISREQIIDQIDSLNKDFQLQNADTVNIPAVFKPLAGNPQIEFRLAQLDPNGQCTDGIVRVYSPLTYNARNNVKSLSYWPSNKYLNFWIVNSIANTNGSPGMVIGFAQFPGGDPLTDGVVIKYDFMGSIQAAAGSNNNGRTATHEVGHWLNLRHIWGDAQCGNDQVNDTPTHYDANLSICPTWPHPSSCNGNAPNGDMFTNYMDYTNGDCQNMFSAGQATRMNAALSSVISSRSNLWSAANLAATGTNGTPAVLCPPKADFIPKPRLICQGASTTFVDKSWKGQASSRIWSFPGGTPATDTSANPVVTYNSPGVYDVTLTVTNSSGSDTKTETGMVIVSPGSGSFPSVPFAEDFEAGSFPANWYNFNMNGGNEWEVTNVASAGTGLFSMNLYNFVGNDKGPDEFITNAFSLAGVTGTSLKFDLAFAYSSSTASNGDKLVVYVSNNCGQTWTPRYTKQGTSFPTVAPESGDFYPAPSDFRTETVNLNPSSISGQPNIRFRFEFTHDTGNNIFIDNINLTGIVGNEEINIQGADATIYPNPTSSAAYLDFNVTVAGDVNIEVLDVQGRKVSDFSGFMEPGNHQYTISGDLAKGVYSVRLMFGDKTITKKVVLK